MAVDKRDLEKYKSITDSNSIVDRTILNTINKWKNGSFPDNNLDKIDYPINNIFLEDFLFSEEELND